MDNSKEEISRVGDLDDAAARLLSSQSGKKGSHNKDFVEEVHPPEFLWGPEEG